MNIATLLIHSSAFVIVFILLGFLVQSIYRRKVVTPHRRRIEAWQAHYQATLDLSNAVLRQRDEVIRRFRRAHDQQERTISDLTIENLRLKQNISYLADRYEHTWRRLMVARALLEAGVAVLHSKGQVAVRKSLK